MIRFCFKSFSAAYFHQSPESRDLLLLFALGLIHSRFQSFLARSDMHLSVILLFVAFSNNFSCAIYVWAIPTVHTATPMIFMFSSSFFMITNAAITSLSLLLADRIAQQLHHFPSFLANKDNNFK